MSDRAGPVLLWQPEASVLPTPTRQQLLTENRTVLQQPQHHAQQRCGQRGSPSLSSGALRHAPLHDQHSNGLLTPSADACVHQPAASSSLLDDSQSLLNQRFRDLQPVANTVSQSALAQDEVESQSPVHPATPPDGEIQVSVSTMNAQSRSALFMENEIPAQSRSSGPNTRSKMKNRQTRITDSFLSNVEGDLTR